jgi:hypothetical protein
MFGRQKINHVQQFLFALNVIIKTGRTDCPVLTGAERTQITKYYVLAQKF